MLIAASLAVLASFDPSSLTTFALAAQQAPATQTPGAEVPASEGTPAAEPAPAGAAEGAAAQTTPEASPATPPSSATEPSSAAEASAETPAASAPSATSAAPAVEKKPEVKTPYVPPPYKGRVRYVWPFAKEHELLPGDVRIPLPIWAMAVGGGVAVAAGVPFYTLARSAESRLISGDDTIRTDADRAEVVRYGRSMEAWGIGLWATGGVLVAASWTAFYVLGFQDKPKGLNYQLSVGPQGGLVQLELALP